MSGNCPGDGEFISKHDCHHHFANFVKVKSVFLQWLPWFLRMSRPGKKITRKTINMNNKMNELSLKEKACKSLLANVLDMDDDLR